MREGPTNDAWVGKKRPAGGRRAKGQRPTPNLLGGWRDLSIDGLVDNTQPSVPGRRQDRTLPPHDITFRHGRYGFVPWLEPAKSL